MPGADEKSGPEATASDPTEEDGARLRDLLAYERRFWGRGFVAGVDEVGRGPLAGPVVAAAVVLPRETVVEGAADSKSLEPEERERLALEITRCAEALGIGAASVAEIDRLNILRATALAMRRALEKLDPEPAHVVVDGTPMKGLGWEHDAVVGGDGRIHTVSCASIVAKVCRDRLMWTLAERYPGYGWETNVGYGTAEHRDALERLGPTPHHRLTFSGVQYELEI